jgi:hypothetical protein
MSDSEAASKSGYRTVVARRCGDENRPGILFSQFGIEAGGDAPEDVEVIAFDESEGIFNYYKIHGDGTFGFFGNSKDFLDGNGASISINDTDTTERDCARCHVGGGLIMKELDAPWVHWHQSKLAGARDVVDANSDVYGDIAVAVNLEGIVKNRNRAWNVVRIDHIRKNQTLEDLLRPLFCSQEIQIESSGNPAFAALLNGRVAFVSPLTNSGGDFDAEYERLKVELEQQMITGAGSPDVSDTSQGFTSVDRAHLDRDYVSKLIAQDLVDRAFVQSVLMVDFTRPVFSEDRCELLRHTPDLSITNKQGLPKKIRDGFVANLEGRTAAARELRRNLVNSKGTDARTFFRPTINKFQDACIARTSEDSGEDLMRDVMTHFSLQRSKARQLDILEFPGTLAHDKFDDGSGSTINAKTRLSPASCNLVTRFIGVADPAADE